MRTVLQDLRFAVRTMGKNPGMTLAAVLTLALGIGANTAIFSVVNAVLLEPLPFRESEQLVIAVRKQPGELRTIASYPDFTDWQQSGVFEKSAAVVGRAFFLETPDGPQPITGRRVTGEFFDVLGGSLHIGRGFLPDEALKGEAVAVISHSFWVARLAGDPNAVGKDLRLRDQSFRIIGVLPPKFVDPINPLSARDVYVPLVASPEERVSRNSQWVQVVGRLRPGVTIAQASPQIEALSERAQKETAGSDPRSLAPFGLISLRDHMVGDAEPALWLLLVAVGFVLLIGCANISNLLLARITARQHELAIRAAVGASTRRLAAQLATEIMLLSALGAAVAVVFVLWTMDLLKRVSPVTLPRLETAGLDVRVFGFTLLLSAFSAVIFGLLPVLRGARQDVLTTLKSSSGSGGRAHARSRSVLLVAEVALTAVLLVGATLAVTSFQRLVSKDPGFQTTNILAAQMTYAGEWKLEKQWPFFDQFMTRVRAMPGVRGVGVVDNLPFSGAWSQFTTNLGSFAEGSLPDDRNKTVEYQQGVVGGDFFRVMGIPLKAGRVFDEREAAPEAASVIVSESLAQAVWGSADPIGRRVSDGRTRGAIVVGVVGNVRHFGPDSPIVQTLYRPLAQREAWGGTLLVLTDHNPSGLVPEIRKTAATLDRGVVLQRARTMDDLLQSRTAAPRFLAILLGSFGGLALILASLGMYGVLAYSVGQRTREIGVRIAIGASPSGVLRMVVLQGMALAGIGMVIGLVGALALSRFLRDQLFEVSPADPIVYASVALTLTVVAFLACWIPARRAMRVDPISALRYE